MKTLINKKIIIFDLYDTLIDASKLRNPLKKLSLLLPDNSSRRHELKNFILTNDFISLEELIHTVEREFVISVKSNVLEEIRFELYEDLKNVSLFRETKTVLTRLRENYDLYLASNLSTLYIPPVYSLGLDEYFKSFFFSCKVGLKKPDRDFFQLIIDSENNSPSELVMIGDSIRSDFQGAKESGIDAILLRRTNIKTTQQSISSLFELV